MKYLKLFFRNYTKFSGRANRSEYWFAALWLFIINALGSLPFLIIGALMSDDGSGTLIGLSFYYIFAVIWAIICILPSIAISIRRMHDTNRSGAWILINLVPFIGSIIFFIITILPSTDGPNNYGDPSLE